MPTYTELQAETWWNREIVTDPLKALGKRLCDAYGRPATAFGTKGDNVHLYGSHRSQEWLKNSKWCTNRTYTVQSGLTTEQARYIGGFDFNPGSTKAMIEICSRLDKAVRAGRLEVVREWYGNLDGDTRVDGYNNIANRVATSDSSHLWHLHGGLDRTEVNNAAVMKRVGDVLLNEEDDMELADRVKLATWIQDNHPDLGEDISVEVALGSTYGHIRSTKGEVYRQAPVLNTILAAVTGQDVAAAIRAELDRAAARERTERAAERTALLATLTEVFPGLVAEHLADVPAEQVRTAVMEGLATLRLVAVQD
jgi:hypothetical protein